jgi:hypothetical protein
MSSSSHWCFFLVTKNTRNMQGMPRGSLARLPLGLHSPPHIDPPHNDKFRNRDSNTTESVESPDQKVRAPIRSMSCVPLASIHGCSHGSCACRGHARGVDGGLGNVSCFRCIFAFAFCLSSGLPSTRRGNCNPTSLLLQVARGKWVGTARDC